MERLKDIEIEHKKQISKLTASFNNLMRGYQSQDPEILVREREFYENKIKRIEKRHKDDMMILEKRLIKYQTQGAGLDLEFRVATPQLPTF